MSRPGAHPAALAVAIMLAAPFLGRAAAQERYELQPYQMVRSLQLVQDRIAGGDEAALPMQRKLLEMIDAKFLATAPAGFDDPRNFDALLVYAISGGNPVTIETVVSRLDLKPPRTALGDGILGYVRGRPAEAEKALHDIDPLTQPIELGAYLALIKGSVAAADDSAAALKLFDEARLLGPGSLVEEAALRRSIMIALKMRDAGLFLGYSEKYVRRFLHSPYASQFADAFVIGVVEMHDSMGLDKIAATLNEMDAERRKSIYLRLARKSAIDGLASLTAFAARMAGIRDDPRSKTTDPRVLLYSSIASVASGSAGAVAAQLAAIDRDHLSESDQQLLDAARAIAEKVIAAPATPAKSEDMDIATKVAPPRQEAPAVPAAAKPAAPPAGPDAAAMEASRKIVTDTRRKLAAIDELLKETE
ncbi:MAG: chemotaxis protein MotC [Rhizobiales bacterium]|nr:chemotaxis protein MotC [Hyphomicrobiales bacterium]